MAKTAWEQIDLLLENYTFLEVILIESSHNHSTNTCAWHNLPAGKLRR